MANKQIYDAIADLEKAEMDYKKASSVIANIGGAIAYIGEQTDRSNTAWKEYEKGYKQLTGKDLDTSLKFNEKGWLKRTFTSPKDTLVFNDKIYNKEDIRYLGELLSNPTVKLMASWSDESLDDLVNAVVPGEVGKPLIKEDSNKEEIQRYGGGKGYGPDAGPIFKTPKDDYKRTLLPTDKTTSHKIISDSPSVDKEDWSFKDMLRALKIFLENKEYGRRKKYGIDSEVSEDDS